MKAVKFATKALKIQKEASASEIFDLMRGWIAVPTDIEKSKAFSRIIEAYPNACEDIKERLDKEIDSLAENVKALKSDDVHKIVEYRIKPFLDWYDRCKIVELF